MKEVDQAVLEVRKKGGFGSSLTCPLFNGEGKKMHIPIPHLISERVSCLSTFAMTLRVHFKACKVRITTRHQGKDSHSNFILI